MADATNNAPVTIKGVCLDSARRVLLCRNHRAEWELPGGRPGRQETFPGCLAREIREETGLSATIRELAAAYPYEVIPGRWVNVIVYRCEIEGSTHPLAGDEHDRVAFIAPERLDALELADGYREAIDACLTRA